MIMTGSTVFSIANLIVMPMWALMIFAPKWKGTQFLIDYKLIPLLLAILYAIYTVININAGVATDFSSLASVMKLFTVENAVLAGWIHYLAFDLFIGTWEVGDAIKRGINRWFVLPCLLCTFMLGPVGLVLYFILRAVMTKKVAHENF